jgi:hypothetical protein
MVSELFTSLIRGLETCKISYMVSGSMAMLVYTVARTTRDIDIVIELTPSLLPAFYGLFDERFYLHKPAVEESLRREGFFNIIDPVSGMKIDFIVRKNSVYRKTEFDRRQRHSLFGQEAWFVSLEDLILSKLIWIQQVQSGRQMEDIRNLLEHPATDRAYLQKWISELNLTTFGLV